MNTIRLTAHGHSVRMTFGNPLDHIAKVVMGTERFYEQDLLENAYSRLEAQRGLVVDVGAHVGNHVLWFAGIMHRSVVALEPNPKSFWQLNGNVVNNGLEGLVELHCKAAGSHADRCDVIEAAPELRNSGRTTVEISEHGSCEMIALDAMNLPTVSLLKIDVEGMAKEVLEGAEMLVSTDRPIVYAELDKDDLPWADEFFLKRGMRRFGVFAKTPTYGWAADKERTD